MIQVEKIDVWGFEHTVRGLRNPMNSWDKSDSEYCDDKPNCAGCVMYSDDGCHRNGKDYIIGKNDLDLMRKLFKASLTGNHAHRKYLRQIVVSMDITAPLYWWKEFDTYKVGTVANSCSTMHKIHSKEFTLDDFSREHLESLYVSDGDKATDDFDFCNCLNSVILYLNVARKMYLETKDKKYWWQMIQLLPTSYNQKRTVTMNYENVITIILQRTGHKLDEWNEFVDILCKLPYIDDITKKEE